MNYQIQFTKNPASDDIQFLGDAIQENASQQKGHKALDFFGFFIRDENEKIIAGCNGCNLYGCLYIDQLWVHASFRKKGYGKSLVTAAEKYGREQGCMFGAVNTFDWEALEFYKKLGYLVDFERHGFAKNSVFYFLRKTYE